MCVIFPTLFFDNPYQNNSYMVIKSFNINRYDVREIIFLNIKENTVQATLKRHLDNLIEQHSVNYSNKVG